MRLGALCLVPLGKGPVLSGRVVLLRHRVLGFLG